MSNFQKYPTCPPKRREYKDPSTSLRAGSGVDWLGKIPEDWEVKKLKFLLEMNDGGVWGDELTNSEKDCIVLRSTEVQIDGSWAINNPAHRLLCVAETKKDILRQGDLLVTKSSGSAKHIGKTAYVTKEVESLGARHSNFMQRLRLKNSSYSKFIHHILNNQLGREQMRFLSSTTTGLQNLNEEILGEIIVAIPPQNQVSDITRRAEAVEKNLNFVAQKNKKQIDLLQEYRQSLISNVVTGKYKIENGELVKRKPSELKDSGIPWLGLIPEGWGLYKLGFLAKGFNNGTSETQIDEKTSYPVSRIETISTGQINPGKVGYVEFSSNILDYKLEIGDVLLSHINSLEMVGNSAVYEGKPPNLLHGMNLLLLRPCTTRVCKQYFPFLVKSYYVNESIKSISKHAINQVSVNSVVLKSMKIPVPSLLEQKELVHYLQQTLGWTKRAIELVKFQNQKIEEYKKSLIYNVVTGKVKV